MARGWESKSVEQQQDELASQKSPGISQTPEQIARANRLRGLELSKQNTLQQLQTACNSRLRQMLEAALADLDRQIEQFSK